MPNYELNQAAVRRARQLIGDGTVDVDTQWSDAAPSADDGNTVIQEQGWDGYAAWHLAVDPDAGEETKKRYHFPYGDFSTVNRAALIHGKQRAAQNDHDEVEKAFDDLLQRLDEERS
ncbi:hypothetical protein [Blastococcus goldschmidtiae]|uniref:Bacteriophage HK97-gp10, tail-component n=1 Tax=Blastococcus goldschmidtiae TaxID=3075546 RepID=A0ABU2KA13_9ACTN|nr:hypothetical protein [Blastococcus sp. DSM 46792]MDT0277034.1 hypothetical protein [Blastococcus sp. DSM 46792]